MDYAHSGIRGGSLAVPGTYFNGSDPYTPATATGAAPRTLDGMGGPGYAHMVQQQHLQSLVSFVFIQPSLFFFRATLHCRNRTRLLLRMLPKLHWMQPRIISRYGLRIAFASVSV